MWLAILLVLAADAPGDKQAMGPLTPPAPPVSETAAPAEAMTAPSEPPSSESEAIYRKVLKYHHERLRVVPVPHAYMASMIGGGYSSRWFGEPLPWFGEPTPWVAGVPVAFAPYPSPNDWVIARGAAGSVDEADLARLLGDERIAKRIEEGRFWPRVIWATGFGAGAVAGIGTGSYLYQRDGQDSRAAGVSLITVGAVCGVLALLTPALGNRHVLSVSEAETLVDRYNEKLRAELSVTPDEIAKYPAP